MKCLLCNEWIEPVAQLSDLIMFKQRREYSCEDCKAQFKKLGKARCSNCYKIIVALIAKFGRKKAIFQNILPFIVMKKT